MRFECHDFNRWNDIREEWRILFEKVSRPCVFYHHSFFDAAALPGLSSKNTPHKLVLGYEKSELVFGLPVSIDRHWGLLKTYSFYTIKSEGFDHLAPLDISQDHRYTKEFINSYEHILGAGCLKIEGASAETANLFNGSRVFLAPYFACPFKQLPTTPDEILSTVHTNFRTELRSKTKLCDTDHISFHIIDHKGKQSACLQELMKLHTHRYEQKEGISKFNTAEGANFHEQLISSNTGHDFIYFFELKLGELTIASLYGFLVKDTFYYYQISFLPEYKKYSPGAVLIYRVIQFLIAKGVHQMDFLRGNELYKAKWTETRSQDYFVLYHYSFLGKLSLEYEMIKRLQRREGKMQGLIKWMSQSSLGKHP